MLEFYLGVKGLKNAQKKTLSLYFPSLTEEEQQRPLKELTEEEKDDLYGKIAERLAMIGDNLTVEREMELARSAASSPGYKLAAAEGGKEASPEPGEWEQ